MNALFFRAFFVACVLVGLISAPEAGAQQQNAGGGFPTSVTVMPSPNPLISGQNGTGAISIAATGAAAPSEGTVSLTCGDENLGAQNVVDGQAFFGAMTTGDAAGDYTCTARYSDSSGSYASSTGTAAVTVLKQTSSVTLTSPTTIYHEGQQVTLTATVTGEYYTPNHGIVAFKAGHVELGDVQVNTNGKAVLTFNANGPEGMYRVTALYTGTQGTDSSAIGGVYTLEP